MDANDRRVRFERHGADAASIDAVASTAIITADDMSEARRRARARDVLVVVESDGDEELPDGIARTSRDTDAEDEDVRAAEEAPDPEPEAADGWRPYVEPPFALDQAAWPGYVERLRQHDSDGDSDPD